jgi:Flp pilus assembly CpaE family ATPase
LARLLEILRRRYKFLVCDAPFPASRIGREMFDVAHQRVLVTEPSVAGARDVLRYLAVPQPPGAAGAPLVVLNMAGLNGSVSATQFERAVGRKPDLVIPHIKGVLRAAADLGEPAAATNRPVRRAMQNLALRAASVGEDPPAQRRGLWGRR